MLQVETGVENIGNLVLRQRSTSVTSALIASLRSGCADPGGGADIASECITSRAFVKFRETMEFPWEFPCEFVNFHGWIFLFIFLWWINVSSSIASCGSIARSPTRAAGMWCASLSPSQVAMASSILDTASGLKQWKVLETTSYDIGLICQSCSLKS